MKMSELKVGQKFVWQDARCLAVDDHLMMGGVAFAILSGPRAGETGYVEGDDLLKEVERPKINLDAEKLEETIKGLERIPSTVDGKHDRERNDILSSTVDYLTELGIFGYGDFLTDDPEDSAATEEGA